VKTIFCKNATQAQELAQEDKSGESMVTGAGTLAFHSLIAQHASGVFDNLYVAPELRGKFMVPCGGEVEIL